MNDANLGIRAAEVMGVARQLDRILQALGESATPDVQANLAELRRRVQAHAGELFVLAGQVYEHVYTKDELNNLIAFLESPTGVAMISKQPQVEQRMQEISQAFLQRLQSQ